MRRRNTLLLNPMKNRDHFDRQLSLLAGEFATTSRIVMDFDNCASGYARPITPLNPYSRRRLFIVF